MTAKRPTADDRLSAPTPTLITNIKPAAANPRLHSEHMLALLTDGIKRHGFTSPIIVDEGGILIAGHARLQAAIRAGLRRIPTVTATGWTADDKTAYAIADNRLAELAAWDNAAAATELAALAALGITPAELGFDPTTIANIHQDLDLTTDTDPNDSPHDDPPPTSWQLGDHLLAVLPLTNTADRTALALKSQLTLITSSPPAWPDYVANTAYVWTPSPNTFTTLTTALDAGLTLRQQLILPRNDGSWWAASILTRPNITPLKWRGGPAQSTVWEVLFDNTPTAPPPAETRRLIITNHLDMGGSVFDPDDSTGETIMAAEHEGRVAVSVVDSAAAAKRIIKTYTAATNKPATPHH